MELKNIKKITDNLLCSGCGTCNAICGHNAISMKKSSTMGLLYAEIDSEKCVDCGLCLRMCPSSNIMSEKMYVTQEQIIGNIKECYVGRTLNKEIFDNAQSGGLVTEVLSYLFENNMIDAVVSCRMDYGSPNPRVNYSIITECKDLLKNQKSLYVQVDLVSALKETSKYKSIAVVGIPCHIQGICNLMELNKFKNIKYKIGLICDKSYSYSYMDAIMNGVKKPKGDIKLHFKKKNFYHKGNYYSYQNSPSVIINREGDMALIENKKRMFLKDYFALPKCKVCWDKLNVHSDLVFGDPWGLKGKYDENEGDSLILIRSDIGNALIDGLVKDKRIAIDVVHIEDVVEGQFIKKRVQKICQCEWNEISAEWKKKESLKLNIALRSLRLKYIRYRIVKFIKRKMFAL